MFVINSVIHLYFFPIFLAVCSEELYNINLKAYTRTIKMYF